MQQARDDARAERHRLRRGLRPVWRTDRVTACGRSGARPDGDVVIRHSPACEDRGAVTGASGVFTCGAIWLCPECAQKVASHRAAAIERALGVAVGRGGWVVLVTMTLRHRAGHGLDLLLSALQNAWRAVRSGRRAQRERDELGILGIVRSVELTHGQNGWHPHVHALVVFETKPPREVIEALAEAMFTRWCNAVERAGLPRPMREHGLDVSHLGESVKPGQTLASLASWARYAVKGITGEAVMGVAKDAKGTNRSVRQLMHDAVVPRPWVSSDGRLFHATDDTAVALLREMESASKAVKHLTGLPGLERALSLDADDSEDEDVAKKEIGGDDIAVIAGGYWDTLVEPHAAELFATGEREGPDGIRRWLDDHGVPWTVPVPEAGRTWAAIGEEREAQTRRDLQLT